jgi:hypothetical protein
MLGYRRVCRRHRPTSPILHDLHFDRARRSSKIDQRYHSDCQIALIVVLELGCNGDIGIRVEGTAAVMELVSQGFRLKERLITLNQQNDSLSTEQIKLTKMC